MSYRLKRVITLFLIVFLSLPLYSCSIFSQPASQDVNQEKPATTITFMSYWGGNSPYRDLVEETIRDFMDKNPDINVINNSLSNEDYLSKLKTDIVSGYMPDVFYLWPGYDLESLISAGQVASLSDTMNNDPEWKKTFSINGLFYNNYSRGLYGLPFETNFTGLYINTRILSENGLRIPENYDELCQVIKKLREKGIVPIAYSADTEGSLLYQTIVASLSNRNTSIQFSVNKSWDSSYVEAMKIMRELDSMNAFPENSFIMSGYEQNKLFLSGEAAMVVEGSWFSGYLDQMKDPVELVNFPIIDSTDETGYNLICMDGYGSFHLSSTAFNNPSVNEAAIRFLKYITSQEVVCKFISEKGIISALNLDDSVYESNLFAKRGLEIIRNSKMSYKFSSEIFGEQVWNDIFINEFPYMLENEVTPEQLYDQALKLKPGR